MHSAQGDAYEGTWRRDRRHGSGTLHAADGSLYAAGGYEGDWEAGVPHGFGTATHAGGGSYTGDWVRGEPDGEGAYFYREGDVYRGELAGGQTERLRPLHVCRRRHLRGRVARRRLAQRGRGGRAGVALHEQGWPSVRGALRPWQARRPGHRHIPQRRPLRRAARRLCAKREGTCAYTVGHAIYVGGSVKEGIFARGLLHAVEPACPRVDLGVRLPPPRPRRPMRRESGSGRRCPLTIECTIEYTVP